MHIPMEEEVRSYLIIGFSVIICIAILYTIYLWIKYKRKGYLWVIFHFVSLSFGISIFINVLTGNFMNEVMISEDNSIKIAESGLLWAVSVLFLLKGITDLSRNNN
ncbi:hypothetical protein COM13_22690 [Bacillus pseudomycoides]|uniref:hypothetical protein n=1 Tax=Bacillus pseudomycoides TaxID=64104 RepID=UPI000BF33850|nr:hypothetical protein [Bacillus pseudomycoides]PGB82643.1 hypothetical protein COM13_22690 [Bacillus pseudomycoides]